MKAGQIGVLVCAMALPLAGWAQDGGAAATSGNGPQVEKCDAPKGTIAVHEPQDDLIARLRSFGLASPTAVIRMMIQQSNCFQVIERGVAMQNLMQERQLADSGLMQQGSNMGKGQMVTADFLLTPNITFSENNAGGVGAGMLGMFGGVGHVLGALAGSLKFKEAETSMLLVDARSGIQVAAAEGKAEKTDFALGGALFGGAMAGGGGGYTKTNEGKIIVASFLDNWNKVVRTVRDNPSLIQAKAGRASQQNAANSVQAGAAAEGDVMMPKIANVRVLKQPRDGAAELVALNKTDEVLYLGEEKDGYFKVQASKGEGWVKKVLVRKQ
jgi:curli biogenesis system outer membrane secretion channel CsgG